MHNNTLQYRRVENIAPTFGQQEIKFKVLLYVVWSKNVCLMMFVHTLSCHQVIMSALSSHPLFVDISSQQEVKLRK